MVCSYIQAYNEFAPFTVHLYKYTYRGGGSTGALGASTPPPKKKKKKFFFSSLVFIMCACGIAKVARPGQF